MTEPELIAFRQLLHNLLVSELVVRNTVLLETLLSRINGNADATIQDGIQQTLSLLDEISQRNRKIFAANLEAQMLADEFEEIVGNLKNLATGIPHSSNS